MNLCWSVGVVHKRLILSGVFLAAILKKKVVSAG